jgi:hypothetical protein
MDIETVNINNQLVPYLICAYNGKDFINSFANSLPINQVELFSKFIYALLTFFKDKNRTLIVYAHNFAKFDGIFLLKHLIQFGVVEPLLFNGKLISIKVRLTIEGPYCGKTIIFKDSLLLLPVSLRKLALTYKCTEVKGVFPFKLFDINYSGAFPRFEYFTGLSISQYLQASQIFNNQIWDFKDQAIKYCNLDCLILYEILIKFNELVFNEFKIDISKVLTLPALAMRVYKTNFMPDTKIYQLHGKVEQDIRDSYTGGAVDVYIPHNRLTPWLDTGDVQYETLYLYDVNALYPTVMSQTLMPVGKPNAFEGDIRRIESDSYGFFYCEITSPTFLEHPILQRSIKTPAGLRTIAGLGTWTGWVYSEEMDNAVKYGYTFKIIKGYTFNKGELFIKYISTLYNLRLQYSKDDPMNQIAKLLNNSLYGKFGMKDEITIMEILKNATIEDQAALNSLLDLYDSTISDILDLDTHTLLIRKDKAALGYNKKDDFFHGTEVNVAIAAAITAEARIFMSQFKNNPNFKLYYSDTDSIVTNKPLPESMIGAEMGMLKLEYVIKRAIFLAPKVYALILEDGTEIIKVKGLNKAEISKLHFSDLEALLIKDATRELTQHKCFISPLAGEITIADQIYTLKLTANKRLAVYENGIFTSTRPFNYNDEIVDINNNNNANLYLYN